MELKNLSRAAVRRLDRIILCPEARLQLSAVDGATGRCMPKKSVYLSCRISLWRIMALLGTVAAVMGVLCLFMKKKKERLLKKKWKKKYLKRNKKMSKS
ncbi:MAG: hypothetical protein IJC84_07090 [Clostridia bacterium]|nr:hypothetical protein [Clostridia bacterium]